MEAKELIEILGFDPEKIKTKEDFKTNVDNTFTRNSLISEESEPVKKILGKVYGTLENEIKKVTKSYDLDIDFDSEDLKAKKASEKFKFVFSKYDEKNKSVIEDLKTKAGQGNDEKVKEWEKKYEKISQKAKDFETLLNTTKTEYDAYKQTSSNQIKDVKLDVLKKDVFSKLKLKPDISELEKIGYMTKIHNNYNFDLDDQDQIVPLTKKGERIPSSKVTGQFKSMLEVLEEEAVKEKVFQLNPDGGKQKPAVSFGSQQHQQPASKAVRTVAPRMG